MGEIKCSFAFHATARLFPPNHFPLLGVFILGILFSAIFTRARASAAVNVYTYTATMV